MRSVVLWVRSGACIAVEGEPSTIHAWRLDPDQAHDALASCPNSSREVTEVEANGLARTWTSTIAATACTVSCAATLESYQGAPAVRLFVREVDPAAPPTLPTTLSNELFSNAPDGLCILKGGIVTMANARAAQLLGRRDPTSLIGTQFFELIGVEPTQEAKDYPVISLPTSPENRVRIFVRFPDPLQADLALAVIHDADPEDVRDRVIAKVQESLSGLLRNAIAGTFLFRTPAGEIELSADSAAIFGLPRRTTTVAYDEYMELVHPEDRYDCELLAGKLKPDAPAVIVRRVRVRSGDGYRPIELNYFAADSDPSGKPALIVGTIFEAESQDDVDAKVVSLYRQLAERAADLEEAKHRIEVDLERQRSLESALRANEELYRTLVELSPDGIAYTVNRRIVTANRALLDMSGVDRLEDIVGHQTADFLTESSAAQVARGFAERPFGHYIFPRLELISREGNVTKPVEIHIVRYTDGENVHSISIVRDISQREAAEQEAKRSLARWQNALEGAGHGLWEYFPGEDRIVWSPPCWTMLSYSPVGLPMETVADWMSIMHPDDRSATYRAVLRAIGVRGPGKFDLEFRLRAKDGTYRWVRSNGTVIDRAESGDPLYVLGYQSDTTERRRIAKELEDSRQRLELALEGSGDAIWEWFPERQETIYDDEWFLMLGYRPGELNLRTVEDWQAMVHPDDFVGSWRSQAAHMAGETESYSYQLRLRTKAGDWKWIHSRGRVVERDPSGRPLRFIGLHSDVDEQVRSREALRASQEHLSQIIETSKTGVWAWWPETGHLEVSDSFRTVLGMDPDMDPESPEEWNSRQHPDDVAISASYLQKQISGEADRCLYESRYRRADGTYCWLLISSSVRVRDAQGVPLLIAGTSTDISELKEIQEQLERLNETLSARNRDLEDLNEQLHHELETRRRIEGSLREAEQRWQFALEGSEQGVWDWDPVANTGFWSPRWMEILGYGSGEILIDAVEDFKALVHPDDFEAAWDKQMAHYRGETPIYEAEFRMKTKSGDWKWILSRGKVIERADDGTPLRYVGTHTDIDDRKRTEAEIEGLYAEIRSRAAELETSNRELEAFSYSVSHDLRAPLRRIDGYSAAVLEDFGEKLDEDGRRSLDRIRANARQMGEVIDALLLLSRVTRREMHRESVALSELAQEIADEVRAAEPERVFEFDLESGLVAFGDRDLIKVMLENLFNNAAKFTTGREPARIAFGRSAEGAFFVKDNGVGFDPAYAEKLFRPFERLHSTQEFEGHGIGLATVQRILSRHGGKAWAEGEVDKGATIWFTLDSEAKS